MFGSNWVYPIGPTQIIFGYTQIAFGSTQIVFGSTQFAYKSGCIFIQKISLSHATAPERHTNISHTVILYEINNEDKTPFRDIHQSKLSKFQPCSSIKNEQEPTGDLKTTIDHEKSQKEAKSRTQENCVCNKPEV